MSTHRSFTPKQEQILISLGNVYPDTWNNDEANFLKSEHTLQELTDRRDQLLDHQRLLVDMQSALPPKNRLAEYIVTNQWYNPAHETALVSASNGLQHLELPGNDIAMSIAARYETLEQLLIIAAECIAAITDRIAHVRIGALLPERVLNAIASLPSMSGAEQSQLTNALALRSGTITLGAHPKKDAATILYHLSSLIKLAGAPLTTVELRQLHIVCMDDEFDWYGKGAKGGRARDIVYNIATQTSVRPSPLVEKWIDKHLL